MTTVAEEAYESSPQKHQTGNTCCTMMNMFSAEEAHETSLTALKQKVLNHGLALDRHDSANQSVTYTTISGMGVSESGQWQSHSIRQQQQEFQQLTFD